MTRRDDTRHTTPDDDRSRRASPSPTPPAFPGALDDALQRVATQLALMTPRREAVAEACASVDEALASLADPDVAAAALATLADHLARRRGECAAVLFEFLVARLGDVDDPRPLAASLLLARDPAVRRRAVTAVIETWRATDRRPDAALGAAVAEALESLLPDADLDAEDRDLLDRAAAFLQRDGGEEALEAALMQSDRESVRRLAARILDRGGAPVPAARLARLLGDGGATTLGDLFAYTCPSHRDLVDLTPDGQLAASTREGLAAALATLGPTALGNVIDALGWRAVAHGVWVERRLGVSVDGSFPLLIDPDDADLLERCGDARRVWDRHLVVAHGGKGSHAAASDSDADGVTRFRRYNVLHAELLNEILEVAPVTPVKVRRIVQRLDEVVEHFASLFTGHTDDAGRVADVWAGLRARVLATLADVPDEQPLAAEPTRLVQMFEDPHDLDQVRTLHGLKRYLHQHGLRLAFRRFRSSRTTNRTVDLAVVSGDHVLHALRKIRYLDFEPHPQPGHIPFLPALAVEALGRRLLHGATDAPDLEVLIYGNEVQTFVTYRNHPAFLRIDFSPPLRGGMIDLEYFGVSQYELDHHPDITLPWIQRVLRRLDFDVQADGLRLHVRYDKEHAFDFADLIRGVRRLCALLPHLMDLDWTLGGLRYPEPARAAIADHWADWLAHWGLLPLAELLTGDRRAILRDRRDDPSGVIEVPWDGRGPVRDRFSGGPSADFWPRLRRALADRHQDPGTGWATFQETSPAQLSLQAALQEPTGAPRTAAAPHPPLHLARLLAAGGQALAAGVRLARVVTEVERHLRFVTVGSVQGFPVQQATLLLRGEMLEIAVLRDGGGLARVAVAHERPFRLTPGPRPAVTGGDVAAADLLTRLRRDNYLAAGATAPGADDTRDVEALPAEFRVENPLAAPTPHADDRVLQGVIAAPGKATGVAVFFRPDLDADDVDGAVLFAAALRPEDAPLLRRAAAVVSTGGGILSHAGLIAQELGKPALLIDGCWREGGRGRPALACLTTDHVEEDHAIGPYRVTLHRDRREREELLHEGDLVVVDANLGSLGVLGQDRDTLALQEELRQLDAVVTHDGDRDEGPARLHRRGRLLRATHQLARLLARIESPSLARHAARELLQGHRRAAVASDASLLGGAGRPGLLQHLFANPSCGEAAHAAALHEETALARRLAALCEETVRTIDGAETPHEVLFLRRAVRRLRRLLQDAQHALAHAGVLDGAIEADCALLEQGARKRLADLRARDLDGIARDLDDPAAWWRARARHELLAAIDTLLGPVRDGAPPSGDLMHRARAAATAGEQRVLASLAGRTLIWPADGGRELSPLVGAKAAGLGEIVRVLGPGRVPPWFAVSDAALRQVLAGGIGRLDAEPGLAPGTPLCSRSSACWPATTSTTAPGPPPSGPPGSPCPCPMTSPPTCAPRTAR